jgi:CheY-like chemotaxis protein
MRTRVFVIDDEQVELDVLSRVLRSAGYEVVSSRNAENAIELVRSALPAVILCDVTMPGINGFQVCRRLKKDATTRAIPLILLSEKVDPADTFWAQETGAVALFPKPIDRGQLVAKIEEVVTQVSRMEGSPG